MSTARYSFDIVVYAKPASAPSGPTYSLRGLALPTLAITAAECPSFERTFEEVAADLERFERMYFEPDGSFVWVPADGDGSGSPARRQLDGMLYDRDGRVRHVELKGSCNSEEFDRMTAVLGLPTSGMIFQLTREAVFLDDATFRRYATAGDERETTGFV